MTNGKSPGPHGLSPIFFKCYWNIINGKIVDVFQYFFEHGYMIKPLSHTFISLVPKKDSPILVEHFRPISLCNVVYKIITKILANRMTNFLDKIISPFQSAFIHGRSITDSVITCHKLMQHINRKKGCMHLMAVKIDLAKTYDKVEWAVLERILVLHGFPSKFIRMVKACISSASFSVLVNGSSFGLFQSSRGLRQGDPLSLTLFSIFINLLSRMIIRRNRLSWCTELRLVGIARQYHVSCMRMTPPFLWKIENKNLGRDIQ